MNFKFILNKKVSYGKAIFVCFWFKKSNDKFIEKLDWTKNDNWIKEIDFCKYLNHKSQSDSNNPNLENKKFTNDNKLEICSDIEEIQFEYIYFLSNYDEDTNKLYDSYNKEDIFKCSDIFASKISKIEIDNSLKNSKYNSIKIMTFNIRYENNEDGFNNWEYRKYIFEKYLIILIKENNFDFICFQEVLRNQLHFIVNILPNYNFYCKGRSDEEERDNFKGEMCPIFYLRNKYEFVDGYTFWLSNTPHKKSCSFGNTIPRICTYGYFLNKFNQEKVLIFNAQLDHISKNAQVEGIKLIKKEIKSNHDYIGKSTIFLTGDFNFNPTIDYDGYKFALNTSIVLLDSCDEKNKSQITYHEFLGEKIKIKYHIDYILYNDTCKCIHYEINKSEIEGKYPSDHYPIICKFELI